MLAHKWITPKRIGNIIKIVVALILIGWFIWWIKPTGELDLQFSTNKEITYTHAAKPDGGELPLSGGMKVVADDGNLELSVDLERQLFAIRDKQSNVVWTSSPDVTGDAKINEITGAMVSSPFIFSYTNNQKEAVISSIMKEKATWKAYTIPGGVQVKYDIKSLKIAFTAEFVLEDGGFYINLPVEEIVEKDINKLVSIQPLPNFGAAKQGDDGYIIVPDGTGALTYFNKSHTQNDKRGYSQWIYGVDPTFDPNYGPNNNEQVLVPIVGMVKKDGGYLQTLEKGSEDAKVFSLPPGAANLEYYRGGFELFIRKSYVTRFGEVGASFTRYEKSPIMTDRSIRYDFVSGPDVTYTELADKVSDRFMPILTNEKASNPPLIQLFHGVESRGDSYSKRLETMTTFDEARIILEKLQSEGVNNMIAELKGWYQNGYYGNLPKRFPVEGDFGGEKGLRDLLSWTKEKGIETSLEDNLIEVFRGEKVVSLRTDTIRKPDNEQYILRPEGPTGWYRWRTERHWLNPYVIDEEYFEDDIEKLKDMGVTSVNYRHFGEKLISDYNSHGPLRRGETKAFFESWINKTKEQLGSAGVYYGNAYAAKAADRVLDIPLSTSNDYMLDVQVPFLQILYHGKRPYYSKAINRSDDPTLELLKSIEYGAIPSFELTYRETTQLRYTDYDLLFSSKYTDWLSTIKKAYTAWEEAIAPVAGLAITDHAVITNGVFRTTYSDGTEVWTNYNEQSYSGEGMTVKPLDYAVRKGGGAK